MAVLQVRDIPIGNQTILLPGLTLFQKGVKLDDVLSAMPDDERPSRSYHNPQILKILGIFRFYVSLKTDLFTPLPLSSLKRNKTVWIPRSEARRVLKSQADALLPLDSADEFDGIRYPEGSSNNMHSTPKDENVNVPVVSKLLISDREQFVDEQGNTMHISTYGDRSYKGIRYNVSDIYTACQYDSRNMQDITGVHVQEVIVGHERLRVVDFRNALRLFSHFDRNGASFAMAIMEWCSQVVHSVQYNDDPNVDRMAAHMRTVAGRTCPNPMGECSGKMVYLEILGTVAALKGTWPELTAFVPSEADASEYVAVKQGEGSGHRFGENARAARAIHPAVEPECYDFRSTMLDKQQRMNVEKAFTEEYQNSLVPTNTQRRFKGDTEIFVLKRDALPAAWKYIQSEVAALEHEVSKAIDSSRVSDLEYQLKISELRSQVIQLKGVLNQHKLAVHALPPSSQAKYGAVLHSCTVE